MSVAQTLDIEAYRLLDERLSMDQSARQFQVKIGGSNVNYRRESSTGGSNNSQLTFNLTPNSPNNIIDRTLLFKAKAVVSITRSNAPPSVQPLVNGSRTLLANQAAVRGFNYIVDSTTISINGQSISEETRFIHDVFNRFTDDLDSLVKFKSLTPSLMYGDLSTSYAVPTGNLLNSLGDYNSSTRRAYGRGFYPYTIVENPAANGVDLTQTAKVTLDINELIHLSPCEYQGYQVPGLCNVTSLQLNFNLSSVKDKFWSMVVPDQQVISVKVEFSNAEIQFTEITPPVFYSIPPTISTSYYEIVRQTQTAKLIAPNGNQTLSSNSYQLNQVPSRIIIYAKPVEPTVNAVAQTESYGSITSLNIQYNNMSSIINSASQEQLFMISSVNGTNQSWSEFYGQTQLLTPTDSGTTVPLTGSIICLEFGKDISSDPTAIPGTSVNANFQVTAQVKNQRNVETSFELVVLYVYSGVLVISPGACFRYTSILTRDETLSMPLLEGNKVGSDSLKGGVVCPSEVSTGLKMAKDYLQSGKGMKAGMQARGVFENGTSTGLAGGRSVAKTSLRERFA